MDYKYSIELKWINSNTNGSEDTFQIEAKSINSLSIFNDYENTNMPVLYTDLTIDKKYIDKVIKNAKTAKMYLLIYKLYQSAETELEIKELTEYNGEMSYFIDQDINYNNEIDYKNEPDKKDVLQRFTIGLMFTKCIETNKQTANTTIVKTTRMNAALYFLNSYPYLIDTFTYNDTLEQLIVPPQDSLSKTIDYLNNIKVFYDTPYRFYISPNCVYVLNSTGEGLAKEGEKYNTCMFNIAAIDDKSALASGMSEDSTNSMYYADINVKDTYYTVDTFTNKAYNRLITIIDPSIKNTVTLLDSVNEAVQQINKCKNQILSVVKNFSAPIQEIPKKLSEYESIIRANSENISFLIDSPSGFNVITSDDEASGVDNPYLLPTDKSVNTNIDSAISLANKMKTLYIVHKSTGSDGAATETKEKLVPDETVDGWTTKLKEYQSSINTDKEANASLPAAYKKSSTELIGIMHETTSCTSYLNGVSAINISDNIPAMTKSLNSTSSSLVSHDKDVDENLVAKVNQNLKIINEIKACVVVITEIKSKYEEYLINEAQNSSSQVADNPMDAVINSLNIADGTINTDTSNITSAMGLYKKSSEDVKELTNKIKAQMTNIPRYKTDIKSAITGTWDSLVKLGQTAKKSLDKIINSAKTAANQIKNLDFSVNSLDDLQKDINMVKDISQIGMLGISTFITDLNISGKEGDPDTGDKIIWLANDNANVIKNIKANIENHTNLLSITKTDLDTTVFTLNKKYIIKNYDAHSKTDGEFLLMKKMDHFIRCDDSKFTISTQLELAKVANGKISTGEVSKIRSSKEEIDNIYSTSKNIIDIAKSSNGSWNVSDLGKIVVNAQSIQDSYKKLKNGTTEIDYDKLKMS